MQPEEEESGGGGEASQPACLPAGGGGGLLLKSSREGISEGNGGVRQRVSLAAAQSRSPARGPARKAALHTRFLS